MRLLFVKLGAIGDIVHTLPVLAAVTRALPAAEIGWAVEPRSAEILRGNQLIDHLVEIDTRDLRRGNFADGSLGNVTRQVKELRRNEYDLAIDFQGLIKSALVARVSGAVRRYGFSRYGLREPSARIFYTDVVDVPLPEHVIRKNLQLATIALGLEFGTDIEFPIYTTDEHRREADSIIDRVGPRFAILNPAGGWVTKLWQPEKYGELADLLWTNEGISSVISTGPNEAHLAERVAATSRRAHVVAAQPTLKGLYELARRARVYVGGDTGPTHVAVAAGAPVVGIFGPTEWWRNGSLDPADICVERTDIACRVDCHRRTCGNWICMDTDVMTVFRSVCERLARSAAQAGVVQA
jgi:heptosyltransferase I